MSPTTNAIGTSTHRCLHMRTIAKHIDWHSPRYFLIIYRHTPGATTIDIPSALPSDTYKATSARILRTKLFEKMIKVRCLPKFQREQLVCVDRPPRETATDECQKPKSYNKLISRTLVHYRIIDISSYTITIDEKGIPALLQPTGQRKVKTPHKKMRPEMTTKSIRL